MKVVSLAVVVLVIVGSYFLFFKTTPSGPSIAGDWVGFWDVQALGSKQGEIEAGYGNSVVELHLSRNLFTMLHRYSGTGTIHTDNGPIQEFKVINVSVFPSGQFDGFMVGTGEAKQDGKVSAAHSMERPSP